MSMSTMSMSIMSMSTISMTTMSMSGRRWVAYRGGGRKRLGTEDWERLRGLGGKEKDCTEECHAWWRTYIRTDGHVSIVLEFCAQNSQYLYPSFCVCYIFEQNGSEVGLFSMDWRGAGRCLSQRSDSGKSNVSFFCPAGLIHMFYITHTVV